MKILSFSWPPVDITFSIRRRETPGIRCIPKPERPWIVAAAFGPPFVFFTVPNTGDVVEYLTLRFADHRSRHPPYCCWCSRSSFAVWLGGRLPRTQLATRFPTVNLLVGAAGYCGRMCIVLGDEFDLHARAERQTRHCNCRTGRIRCTEGRRVDAVHRREIIHIDQIHIHLDHVIERPAGSCKDGCEIGEHLACLLRHVTVEKFPCRGIDRCLAGQEQRLVGTNRGVRIRANRCGRVGVGDGCSSHTKSIVVGPRRRVFCRDITQRDAQWCLLLLPTDRPAVRMV